MAGRGGIYKGPYGEKLYGDGRAAEAEHIEVAPGQQDGAKHFDKNHLGWDAIIKWAYGNSGDGVVAVRDIAKEFVDWRTRAQTAEAALTRAREALLKALPAVEEAHNVATLSVGTPSEWWAWHEELQMVRAALAPSQPGKET